MTCVLTEDPDEFADAIAAEGAAPIVFVTSPTSPHVAIITARLRGQMLDVDARGKVALPPLQRGTNVLFLIVEGAVEGDEVRVVEDCGADPEPRMISTKRVGRTASGAEPVLRVEINVR
jgi:hypothetical protein